MFWYYLKRIGPVIALIAGLLTIVNVYWGSPFYKSKKITVDNHSERIFSLGDMRDSLYVYYRGSNGYNIWKSNVKIENTGKQPILGVGTNSVLLHDTIEINVNKQFEIISIKTIQNDLEAILDQNSNTINISFKKWKPKELLKFELLLSSKDDKISPMITGNDREILGAEIKYNNVDIAKIEEKSNDLDWLVRLKTIYPNYVFLISKYWGLILFISLFLSPIYFVISGILENVKFGKWKRKCWKTYLVELERSEIPPTEKVKYKKRPFDIPEKYRSSFTNIPPKPEEPWMLLVLPLFLYILLLPFFIYILFAWYNL